jgi:predicted phosphodiesterase
MRTLIISDLHLNHRNFSQRRLNFIIKLINAYDKVIVNGDLWCAFTSTFNQFYASKWKQLFPYLKAKKTIYINGNHDLIKYNDNRVYEFCDTVTPDLTLDHGNHKFIIIHGHQIANDKGKSELNRRFRRLFNYEAIPMFGEELIAFTLGYKNFSKLMRKVINRIQKKNAKFYLTDPQSFVVTSHTHAFEFDQRNRYINTGRIGRWYASYVTIEEDKVNLRWHTY